MRNIKFFKKKLFFVSRSFPYLVVALVLGSVFLVFNPLLLHSLQTIFPFTDIGNSAAQKVFLVESFRSYGYIPLWNPYLFGGLSFIGNSQVAFFFPTTLLYFFFPINKVISYIFLFDYTLVGIFTYLYARQIKLKKSSALISALIFTFNGALTKQLFLGHITVMDTLIWFPLVMLLTEKLIVNPNLKISTFLGIIIGLMLLAGFPQAALYTLLSIVIYALIRSIQQYKTEQFNLKKTALFTLFAVTTGLLLSTIQYLPTYELNLQSVRNSGIDYEFASGFSLHPKQLPSLIFPTFFGSDFNKTFWGTGSFWGSSIYTGILPFFLFLSALIFKRSKFFVVFLFLIIFSLLYSFGKYGPVFELFYNYVPFFSNLRVPTRILFIAAFSFSIIAGFGIEALLEDHKEEWSNIAKKAFIILSFILFSALLILLVLTLGNKNVIILQKILLENNLAQGVNHILLYTNILTDVFRFFLFTSLIWISLILLYAKKQFSRLLLVIFIVILITDFYSFYANFFRQNTVNKIYSYKPELTYIKNDASRFRIFPMETIGPTISSTSQIESIIGYDPLFLKSYRDFLWKIGPYINSPFENSISITKINNFTNLKLLNVKYVITDNTVQGRDISRVFSGKSTIYELHNTLPRAYIIYKKTPNFSPDKLEFYKKASITKYEPNRISISTSLNQPGYLILSEIYYPGWEAYDNGKKTEIVRSNKIFRAIPLTKGYHLVSFTYSPMSYRVGKFITFLTLLLLVILNAYNFFRKKQSKLRLYL